MFSSINSYGSRHVTHEGADLPEDVDHAAIVGSLLFLAMKTRSDIAYAVSVLSRFMTCAKAPQLKATKECDGVLGAGSRSWDLVPRPENYYRTSAKPFQGRIHGGDLCRRSYNAKEYVGLGCEGEQVPDYLGI
jgi:hypothetical protein